MRQAPYWIQLAAMFALAVSCGCRDARPTLTHTVPERSHEEPRGFTQTPKRDSRQPLSEEIVKAWKDANAEVGWIEWSEVCRVGWLGYFGFTSEKEGGTGELPGFKFVEWQQGVVTRLPAPEAAFGLDLDHTQVTDASLKELARLKSLQ